MEIRRDYLSDIIIVSVIGGLIVFYQAFVTYLVFKCRFIEPKARKIQLLLIWLLPLFGALLCHAVVQSHGRQTGGDDSLIKHYTEAEEYWLAGR